MSVLSSLPSSAGVYWFLDEHNLVLYVGKAKNLKKRVQSYTRFGQLSNRIRQLVKVATIVKFKELPSELEALLTEAELIRRYQPQYNVLLKDDKSPLYIHITNEIYPRVIQVRKKEISNSNLKGTVLGPFPSAYKVKEVLQLVRKIFPWCNHAGNLEPSNHKTKLTPCFYYHIDQCSGACIGKISPQEYQENINQLITFLKGKKSVVTTQLKKELEEAIAAENFEAAAIYRDKLALINEVTQPKKILKPELTTPGLTAKIEQDGVIYLQDMLSVHLGLPKKFPLERIEGYDVSNTMGTNPSVAMVTFIDGVADPANYRLFNIRSIQTPNDYQMMREAISRRQNNQQWGVPDLLVIDGGKGQVRAALSVWGWQAPLIGLVKNPDRLILPLLDWSSKTEGSYFDLKNLQYLELKLQETNPALKLLQRVRNEAHRFSKKQHTKRRLKSMFE